MRRGFRSPTNCARRKAAIVERESPFQASLRSVMVRSSHMRARTRTLGPGRPESRFLGPCARGSIIYIIYGQASQALTQRWGDRCIGALGTWHIGYLVPNQGAEVTRVRVRTATWVKVLKYSPRVPFNIPQQSFNHRAGPQVCWSRSQIVDRRTHVYLYALRSPHAYMYASLLPVRHSNNPPSSHAHSYPP